MWRLPSTTPCTVTSGGRLLAKGSDVLLVHRSAHLEQVYADAQRGDARARTLFGQLETQVAATGGPLADPGPGLVCTSLPSCTVRWSFLDGVDSLSRSGRHEAAPRARTKLRARRQTQRGAERRPRLGLEHPDDGQCAGAGRSQRSRNRGTRGGHRSRRNNRQSRRTAALPSAQQGRITMGVGLAEDASGAPRVLIGTSEPRGYLRPGVLLKSGETLAPGLGHAEADIVNFTQQNGLRLLEVGATRPICPSCAAAIEEAGAVTVTPLKEPGSCFAWIRSLPIWPRASGTRHPRTDARPRWLPARL